MFDDITLANNPMFDAVNGRPNLENDVNGAGWLKQKIVESEDYARRFYGTLCNNGFQHDDAALNDFWTCSWRYAGGMVGEIAGVYDYMYFYCSGTEGVIDPEVREDLRQLRWNVVDNFYKNGSDCTPSKLFEKPDRKSND